MKFRKLDPAAIPSCAMSAVDGTGSENGVSSPSAFVMVKHCYEKNLAEIDEYSEIAIYVSGGKLFTRVS